MTSKTASKSRWASVLLLSGGLGLLAGFALVRGLERPPEPTHAGLTTAQWMRRLATPTGGHDVGHIRQALAALGPAATPSLLRDLKRPSFLSAIPLQRLAERVNSPRLLALVWQREEARHRATLALEWCGADLAMLVPDLLQALDRSALPHTQTQLVRLLALAGPAAVDPVLAWAPHARPDRAALMLEAPDFHLALPDAPPVLTPEREAAIRRLLAQTNVSLRTATLRATERTRAAAAGLADAVITAGRTVPVTGELERAAIRCLAAISTHAVVAVPPLAAWAAYSDPEVRREALLALARYGPDAAPALPAVFKALEDTEAATRLAAINLAGRIGPAAAGTVDLLLDLSHDADALVRTGAVRALGRIGVPPERIVGRLAAGLADAWPDVRREAASALGIQGAAAAATVPHLSELLRDPVFPVRLAAIEALGRIGPAARPAVPALLLARSNNQSGVGRQVLEAVVAIEGNAPPALPATGPAAPAP